MGRPRDIGDVAAARLLCPTCAGRQVQAVRGPADLSYRQIAAILAEATGRPMVAEQIPDEDLRAALFTRSEEFSRESARGGPRLWPPLSAGRRS